ncbi:acetolactate synthase AlsS [Saccharibacter floricola]|uniref:Acetolactate synthase large subunit n=1 Tax=Saccharibacter floricola DSM 15669 TaxID=1123227 RepID=A0ABQ0NZ61_9PROT|nr:acetolactate synthase AlsS [Saccharibacter floricola]GBQ04551.1 acetolactate synthase large subunit [Saccharibacter floricola DSM 15669]
MTQKKAEGETPCAAELIVRNLEAHGVKHVFGIPGAKIDRLFEALEDSSIETVVTRHEQNAAFIAGGLGRITGKAGVAIATSGPGVSNLTTGLATATSEADPMLAIGGAVGRADLVKLTHQSMDTVSMLRPVTKYSAEIGGPAATSEIIANAFRAAEGGRPGGAFVSTPMDVLGLPADQAVLAGRDTPKNGPAPKDVIKEAARALKAAKKPVVLLGMMASTPENAAAVCEFVKKTGVAVVGCYQAAGAISRDLLPQFGGRIGLFRNQHGDHLLHEADLVVTIGYNPIEYDPQLWNLKKDRPLINIDVIPALLDNAFNPSVELVGGISDTVSELTEEVGALNPAAELTRILEAYRSTQKAAFANARSTCQGMLHPLEVVKSLQPFVDQDVTLCFDMGSFHIWLARYLHAFRARQILISNGQQTMGVGLPWGMAASLVNPSQKVISVSGDGGFMMSSMDLETAVRLKSNLIHLVWVDHHFNMVRIQEQKKYGRDAAVAFGPIDFAAFARSCGAKGLKVNSVESLHAALREGMETQGPVVIEIPVDYADNANLMAPLAELRGETAASA